MINPKTELITKVNYIPLNIYNYHNIRMPQTEQRREIYLNLNQPNKFGNIQELTVNLTNKNNKMNENKNNIFIYSKNDFDNCLIKESSNNNNNYNEIKEEKIKIKEGKEESNENDLKEIIIKDISSSDKKLNVFIKYIEIPNIEKYIKKNRSINNYVFLKYFQIDSFTIPSLYQKRMMSNIYYKNYCYGIKSSNNKIKFDKILSSIIEEEEKSKAAGSINNSLVSEEDFNKSGNNFSNYFIQSLKYFSNLLQSIFDEKKKDSYHKFFKTLKKIKNEAFLQGLINEKKSTLSQSKNEEMNEEKETD